jgi:RimJ/RimL family protein N-acetyltransferase
MPTQNYLSKKIGTIEVATESQNMTIRSPRLVFSSVNQHELTYLYPLFKSLTTNPEHVTWFREGMIWSDERITSHLENEMNQFNSGSRFGDFSIHHSETNEFMGILSVYDSPDQFMKIGQGHPNAAEIGYILEHRFWGKGYGTEIAIAGKKYIKHLILNNEINHPINEIVATVHPDNLGSKAILKKTLKLNEPDTFMTYGNNPRLLFFKHLNLNPVPEQEIVELSASIT